MSETPRNQNQMVMYLMGGIIVLLVAVVGILVARNNSPAANIAPVASTAGPTTGANTGANTGGNTGTNTNAAPQAPATPQDFDPNAATKVPKGTTPKQFVEEYYKAITSGQWDVAYKHLPAATQAGTDAKGLQAQIEGYGVTGYTVGAESAQGEDIVVSADQVTASYGTFSNGWVFGKAADGTYVLKSKAVTGMK